ncbi:MAG: hypothetical protein ACREKE_00465, partial [bacterium]
MKDLRLATTAVLGLGLGLALLNAGCHKAPAPVAVRAVAHTPIPTPTPVNDTVAFVREGALWVEHSDGSAQRLLALPKRDQDFWFPTIAPDGSGLVAWLSRSDGTQDLVHVNAEGNVTTLTDTGEPTQPGMKDLDLGNAPSFSPDGKRIAYGFNGNIWIIDADGLNPLTLISDGSSWSPAWSPDGKHIAYVNGNETHRDLWITSVDNSDNVQLTNFAGYSVGSPRWSADGQNLLMTRIHGNDSDIVSIAISDTPPAGTADSILTHDHLSVSAAFSPEGTSIVFSTSKDNGGTWNLYTETLASNNPLPITQDGGLSPQWSKVPLVYQGKVPSPTVTPNSMPSLAPGHPAMALDQANKTRARSMGAAKQVVQRSPTFGLSRTALALAPKPSNPTKAPAPAKPLVRASQTQAKAASSAQERPSTLHLRFQASFDSQDHLDAATEAGLKILALRVRHFPGYTLDVIGPLDESSLSGMY